MAYLPPALGGGGRGEGAGVRVPVHRQARRGVLHLAGLQTWPSHSKVFPFTARYASHRENERHLLQLRSIQLFSLTVATENKTKPSFIPVATQATPDYTTPPGLPGATYNQYSELQTAAAEGERERIQSFGNCRLCLVVYQIQCSIPRLRIFVLDCKSLKFSRDTMMTLLNVGMQLFG